jgi:hypothetical protein
VLQSFETVIDENGNISIPKTVQWRQGGRAVVVLFGGENVEPPRKSGTVEVQFLHPRNATVLVADIDPEITGREVLQILLEDAFITPIQSGEAYGIYIERLRDHIAPNMTFAQAGVIDKDVLQITLAGQGGGPTPAEVVQLVFATAAVALAFLKAARPIVLKLLQTRLESKSVKAVLRSKERELRASTRRLRYLKLWYRPTVLAG